MHVRQRGHDGAACFREDTDYLVYLSVLRDMAQEGGCALHAYCLMTNHVHLLVTPSEPRACARLMRNLGQRYVQYFNRRYHRSGTLWEGRFRSCLVDSASYVLACHRYIERNPVRAGMVASAADYPWSSHAGNSGQALNTLLAPHPEYLALGLDVPSRHAAYRALLDGSDEPAFVAAVRDATNGGFALVGEALKTRLAAATHHRLVRKSPGRRSQRRSDEADISAELGLRPRLI